VRIERRTDQGVILVAHAPHQIGEGLAHQGRGVGQRRDVLADGLYLGVVHLELDPLGLPRQLAEFVQEANEVISGAVTHNASNSIRIATGVWMSFILTS